MRPLARWLSVIGTVSVVTAGIVVVALGLFQGPNPADPGLPNQSNAPVPEKNVGKVLAAEPRPGDSPAPVPGPAVPPAAPASRAGIYQNLLVIPDCRLNIIYKQEVPSQRDGQLLYVATEATPEEVAKLPPDQVVTVNETYAYIEIQDGEKVPPEEVISLDVGAEGKKEVRRCRRIRETDKGDSSKVYLVTSPKKLRRLKEGDEVKKDQLLALVDPMLAVDEYNSKATKVAANRADWNASVKTRDEAEQRFLTLQGLWRGKVSNTVSWEDVRGARLTFDRYFFEEIGKKAAITQAEAELNQSLTVLKMHEIRSKIPGVVKSVAKNEGEWVKAGEQVMMLNYQDLLRAEGYVDMQHMVYLPRGTQVVVEPYQPRPPQQVLSGHLQEVKAVAVSKNRAIVSASLDRTVRIWDRQTSQDTILQHPAAVLSVACSPPADRDHDLCLSGAADGVARLWDLSQARAQQARELRDEHRGAINAVAFSPDGAWCATGSDDRTICVWDVNSGKVLGRLADNGHRGAVTSVQFLSKQQVVSAGKDNQLLVWNLNNAGQQQGDPEAFDTRTGDVPVLGVNPKDREVLFDEGKELRILSLPGGRLEGVLQNPGGAMNFSTMAIFSPDGNLVLSNVAGENRLQLWRAPTKDTRGHELRHLVWPGAPITCGAFAPVDPEHPEESFIVTGTEDQRVVVWAMPTKEEIQERLTGTVTLTEGSVDYNARQVRVWAEVDNKRHHLVPGATATLVVYPGGGPK